MLLWTMCLSQAKITVLLQNVNTKFLFESVAMDLVKMTFVILCNDNAISPNFVWSVILNAGLL